MRLTYAMLEKQNKDLRICLSNQAAKAELKEQVYLDEIAGLKKALGDMPKKIQKLEGYKSKCNKLIASLRDMIKSLRREKKKALALAERWKLLFGKLKARQSKDSSTSDKPSSLNIFKKPKPQSLREKSGKKPGGQSGHPGHGLKRFEKPTEVIDKKPETCIGCNQAGCGLKYTTRQKVDIRLVTHIIEERVYEGVCPLSGKKVWGSFSEGYNNPVQYGENLKSAVALISEHGCVSVSKTAEIINSMSESVLKISCGTVINIQRELSKRLEDTINIIRIGLCAGSVLNADETGCRVNGGLSWMQVFCNEDFTLYNLNKKRGDIDDDGSLGMLAYFIGILVHDHFISYYRYKLLTHAECNQHILRYLKSLIEIFKHSWAQEMSDLLKGACHEKNELLRAGKSKMPAEAIARISEAYDAILEKGKAEYAAATNGNKKRESYYADERRLLCRLEEYKDEHLRFLNNFKVPFSNNLAEQGCRALKGKLKVSGCFRSDEGALVYARILSLISTLKKQDKNIFDGIRKVFTGEVPIASSA